MGVAGSDRPSRGTHRPLTPAPPKRTVAGYRHHDAFRAATEGLLLRGIHLGASTAEPSFLRSTESLWLASAVRPLPGSRRRGYDQNSSQA